MWFLSFPCRCPFGGPTLRPTVSETVGFPDETSFRPDNLDSTKPDVTPGTSKRPPSRLVLSPPRTSSFFEPQQSVGQNTRVVRTPLDFPWGDTQTYCGPVFLHSRQSRGCLGLLSLCSDVIPTNGVSVFLWSRPEALSIYLYLIFRDLLRVYFVTKWSWLFHPHGFLLDSHGVLKLLLPCLIEKWDSQGTETSKSLSLRSLISESQVLHIHSQNRWTHSLHQPRRRDLSHIETTMGTLYVSSLLRTPQFLRSGVYGFSQREEEFILKVPRNDDPFECPTDLI